MKSIDVLRDQFLDLAGEIVKEEALPKEYGPGEKTADGYVLVNYLGQQIRKNAFNKATVLLDDVRHVFTISIKRCEEQGLVVVAPICGHRMENIAFSRISTKTTLQNLSQDTTLCKSCLRVLTDGKRYFLPSVVKEANKLDKVWVVRR